MIRNISFLYFILLFSNHVAFSDNCLDAINVDKANYQIVLNNIVVNYISYQGYLYIATEGANVLRKKIN